MNGSDSPPVRDSDSINSQQCDSAQRKSLRLGPALKQVYRHVVAAWLVVLVTLCSMSPTRFVTADEGLDDYNVAVSLFNQSRWKPAADSSVSFW